MFDYNQVYFQCSIAFFSNGTFLLIDYNHLFVHSYISSIFIYKGQQKSSQAD